MEPGVTAETSRQHMAGAYATGPRRDHVSLNWCWARGTFRHPAHGRAHRLYAEHGSVVLLKMNPVNEYLGPIFEGVFAPLIDARAPRRSSTAGPGRRAYIPQHSGSTRFT